MKTKFSVNNFVYFKLDFIKYVGGFSNFLNQNQTTDVPLFAFASIVEQNLSNHTHKALVEQLS